ncbi:MAG: rRNA maturation RNase YbeY [Novosphingobium sp. 28-62-57]|uniref:rRNA maturation RNase YbeY n=1 Tax=unclassified Novosphingobium TaxID=2644732 RepID=UPI000BCD1E4E|nr:MULTISPECIES: rRNA maturation RNase YbeY [unclassified Novosphingobium]OYW51082.1 MAG: rRNA maturation RNase YbeY [Novosphingobium sp. 12-62-10]OYZ11097.1 MAG: rRNA maturation RNase YbeY [Novosphingobium sp. 28-62-57]OZA39072.1 MAG: rRNA maturation RNase YbeY [Novosphingobium sp. 17-62-9]HQS71479.1 rRNA maturation RNase YbeY [Novosphingobium sp.]
MTAPTLEIDIDPVWGDETDWEALANRAAEAAGKIAPELAHENLLVSLVLADDEEVHTLNKQWRAKDKPTNVLSFPMLSREEVLHAAADEGAPGMLGDMILAHGVCTREAAERGVSTQVHATHLIVHGLLHLAGYDHELGEAEAEEMEELERKTLALMGIADPYAVED